MVGQIKDAFDKKVDNFVSVMLYERNESFTDSIVYKEVPRYITNTLDSLKTFKLDNLKAGNYLLVAMKDYNNNNKCKSPLGSLVLTQLIYCKFYINATQAIKIYYLQNYRKGIQIHT